MNVAAAQVIEYPITVRLTPSEAMPRKLVVGFHATVLVVLLFPDRVQGLAEFANAAAAHADCFLQTNLNCPVLHVGCATFYLTKTEADILKSQLGPLGLRTVAT